MLSHHVHNPLAFFPIQTLRTRKGSKTPKKYSSLLHLFAFAFFSSPSLNTARHKRIFHFLPFFRTHTKANIALFRSEGNKLKLSAKEKRFIKGWMEHIPRRAVHHRKDLFTANIPPGSETSRKMGDFLHTHSLQPRKKFVRMIEQRRGPHYVFPRKCRVALVCGCLLMVIVCM